MARIVLVTGAARGIGLEVCRRLAAAGLETVLTARDDESGRAAAGQLGDNVTFMQLDVTDPAGIDALARAVATRYGRLDVLINNAAVSDDAGGVVESDPGRIRRMMETNFYGAFYVSRALLPVLQASEEARIINVTSGMGLLGKMKGDHAGYRLSKAALNALTVLMAEELIGTTITVNAVSPGRVRTRMGGPRAPLSVEEGAEAIVKLATRGTAPPTGKYFTPKGETRW